VEQLIHIAYVDIIDACQMKRPTCVRGLRTMENSSGKMSLEELEKIIVKLKSEGHSRIGLFNWTEPFLNRTLQQYITKVNQLGLPCDLSTTLSLRRIDNLEDCLRAGIDLMIISISGMDQATYQINHIGGALEYVFSNLRKTAGIISRYNLHTTPVLRFIKFDYNSHQVESAEQFADKVGVKFQVIEGAGNPKLDKQPEATNEFFLKAIEETSDKIATDDFEKACPLVLDTLSADHKGDSYLCCAMPNKPALRIGKHLEFTDDEILLRRHNHPFCRSCAMTRRDTNESDKQRFVRALKSSDGLRAKPRQLPEPVM
jgi:molybdenum cofactor biosynthesis enzyme MoaA